MDRGYHLPSSCSASLINGYSRRHWYLGFHWRHPTSFGYFYVHNPEQRPPGVVFKPLTPPESLLIVDTETVNQPSI